MSETGTPAAVRKTITVRCDVKTAVHIWTQQIQQWWPAGHSRSRDPATQIILEPRSGGRFYERTPSGIEYEWGQVVTWDPPHQLSYDWYLGSGPQEPTRVDVRFVAQTDGDTRIDILHRGPEFVGQLWTRNQSIYAQSWDVVMGAYGRACLSAYAD